MSGLGFGTIGITAGSWAAAIQSFLGCVSSGSLFAIFQSFGMLGYFNLMSFIGYFGGLIGMFFP